MVLPMSLKRTGTLTRWVTTLVHGKKASHLPERWRIKTNEGPRVPHAAQPCGRDVLPSASAQAAGLRRRGGVESGSDLAER